MVSENSPNCWPSPKARRQSPRFSMSACFDSSTSTSRGLVLAGSLPSCEMNPVFEMLKCRRRLLTSLRAVAAGSGTHSETAMKLAGIFSSASRASGRVSPMASFIVRIRTKSIADAKVVAFGFKQRIGDLVVEKLRVPRLAGNAPVVIVDQSSEEAELAFVVQNLDPHEVGELAHECLHLLLEPRQVALDLRPQQRLHPVVGELGFQLVDSACRVMEEPAQVRRQRQSSTASLRARLHSRFRSRTAGPLSRERALRRQSTDS